MKVTELKLGMFYIIRIGHCVKITSISDENLFSGHRIEFEYQDSDYKIKKGKLGPGYFLYECRRTEWDVIPRDEEPANFTWRTSKNNKPEYYCVHCEQDEVSHELVREAAHGIYLSSYRVCTGCGRKDGPWAPYGDD